MYILFEKRNSRDDDNILNYDCMGYTNDEDNAQKYVEENPEYRKYKYCPKEKVM